MFQKLKQIRDLKSAADRLKKSLAAETIEAVALDGKIKISVDGNQEIQSVTIDPSLAPEADKIAAGVKAAVNDAVKKAQKTMAEKISQMGDFHFPN